MNLKSKALTVSLLLTLLVSASGQTPTTSETFSSFWKSFKQLMAQNDKQAVADATKLPFLFDSEQKDREGFIKIYDKLFTRKVRRCIATAKPIKEDNNYDVFCGELIFYFGKDTDGKYKLLEFGVND